MITKKKITCLFLITTILLTLLLITDTTTAETQNPIEITDYSGKIQTISYSELEALPKTVVEADLFCYESYVNGGQWAGVKLSELLSITGIDVNIIGSAKLVALDGYTVFLNKETIMRHDIIIAYEKDGQPITEVYRLIFPGENGDHWIAWITGIVASYDDITISQTGSLGMSPTKSDQNSQIITSTPAPTQPPSTSTVSLTPAPIPTNLTTNQQPYPSETTSNSTIQNNNSQDIVSSAVTLFTIAVAVVIITVLVSVVLVYRRKC
jgi:hypothetical protein